ncbi:MAG: pyridoxal phosphate-dependent aminotransferase [Acidobacteria bacterium]|nr:pyridoxal phosphate-dependent aminotransferase [Acidobacteriota bacterium]
MGAYLDSVPASGIIRIRDMMFAVTDPFRLDQGDVSFDAPDTVKAGMTRAIAENRSHYVQTTGLPRLQELIAGKLRLRNGVPVGSAAEILVTNGGVHALYLVFQALLEPGDEVILPDPQWPQTAGAIIAAQGVPVRCPLHESLAWRPVVDEIAEQITPRTRAIYLNSPHNPTGGVLTRRDVERIASLAHERQLWLVSDEAYEDVVFEGEHVSPASLPGMYERTVPVYTFSKTYAMTGLRLGYAAVRDATMRERIVKILALTASNVCSVVQCGGIAGLEGPQDMVEQYRQELLARRDLFYEGIGSLGGILSGRPPCGAFYAFLRIDPGWRARAARLEQGLAAGGGAGGGSCSWDLAEYLIRHGRVGCIPGVDFGPCGEGFLRFCFARGRAELEGALDAMRGLFTGTSH